MMAFDCTYLTATLAQLELHDAIGLVGGTWTPSMSDQAFVSLEGQEVNTAAIPKSLSMQDWGRLCRQVIQQTCGFTHWINPGCVIFIHVAYFRIF